MQCASACTQVAYITRKVFADGSEEIRIKHNNEITVTSKLNAIHSRKLNKITRELKKEYFERKKLSIPFYDPNRERKLRIIEKELQARNLKNVIRSAHRARQKLYDIVRCNEFYFFVTWTFDQEKVARLDDKVVKRKFTQFQNDLRKKFPQMYYVAVPEYHEEGGLHFHLLIGGVTMEELKAVPARYVKGKRRGKLMFKHGLQIFNVTRWKYGFSTLSKIKNVEAAKHYICKYITKQHFDDRFFGKRRYYVSNNIRRPIEEKYVTLPEHCMDGINLDVYDVAYANMAKKFAVFTHDGNGIANSKRNSDEVREYVKQLRVGAFGCGLSAPKRGARVPYSTIGTLNSKFNRDIDWNYEKNRLQRVVFKTLRDFKPPHEDYNGSKLDEQTILDEYYSGKLISSYGIIKDKYFPEPKIDYDYEIREISAMLDKHYSSMHDVSCKQTKSAEELCREIGLID